MKNKIGEKQSILAFIFLFCMNYCQRINVTILNCYVSLHTYNSPFLEEILISKQLKMSKWVIFLLTSAFYSKQHFIRVHCLMHISKEHDLFVVTDITHAWQGLPWLRTWTFRILFFITFSSFNQNFSMMHSKIPLQYLQIQAQNRIKKT